ncbi:unnamed protein product [Lymnaea stagnalis]|uniref:Phospholipase A2 n=1 Tax=Lymnaea stagnalis TaxID=6523 RepID=A0AAV2H6Y2_LYMST
MYGRSAVFKEAREVKFPEVCTNWDSYKGRYMHACFVLKITMTIQETNSSPYRMLGLLLILLATVNRAVTSPLQATEARSEKRGLIEMAKIIEYYTKRSAFDYNGYGCYCGLGGSGVPVDAVDRCCKGHDDCYSGTSCWVTHLSWSTSRCTGGSCVCLDKVNSCGYQACQCDVTLGRCLASAPYIKSNIPTCKKG